MVILSGGYSTEILLLFCWVNLLFKREYMWFISRPVGSKSIWGTTEILGGGGGGGLILTFATKMIFLTCENNIFQNYWRGGVQPPRFRRAWSADCLAYSYLDTANMRLQDSKFQKFIWKMHKTLPSNEILPHRQLIQCLESCAPGITYHLTLIK